MGFLIAGIAALAVHVPLVVVTSGGDYYQDVGAGVGAVTLGAGIGLLASGHDRMNKSRPKANLAECPD